MLYIGGIFKRHYLAASAYFSFFNLATQTDKKAGCVYHERTKQAHRSLSSQLQQETMNQEALQLLVTRTMPYGKYKDRLLADLPGHYLGWFAREGFPSGELGSLIALMYELDHNALRHLLDPLRRP